MNPILGLADPVSADVSNRGKTNQKERPSQLYSSFVKNSLLCCMLDRFPLVVVGGGAAGMLAAWKAASLGARVLLLERNKKLGIKLLISGGGKCNITHSGSAEEILTAFERREARFLKPSLYEFSPVEVVTMIEDGGVKTYTRDNGRVFPVSGRADDVVAALSAELQRSGVEIRLRARVESLNVSNHQISGVVVGRENIQTHHLVLATGGASYPKTGTTGDGFAWAAATGHTIVPVRPALAPITVSPRLPLDWRGVALRNGCLSVYSNGGKLTEWRDDILFTHEGISGPAALELSRSAAEAMNQGSVELRFDFFPTIDFQEVDEKINRVVLAQRGKMIISILEAWLPNRIVPRLLQEARVDSTKRGHVLTRDERRSIVRILKSWSLGTVSRIDIERGEVTAGGVSLDEIDPRSMRSRKIRGLYICGEVLDIAGPVGGYNLQAAFSTGVTAGKAAGNDWLSESA